MYNEPLVLPKHMYFWPADHVQFQVKLFYEPECLKMVATKFIKSGEQIVRPNWLAYLSKLNDLPCQN